MYQVEDSKRMKQKVFYATAVAFILIIAIAVGLSVSSMTQQRKLLEESVQAQLIATCNAAMEILDIEKFVSYNSEDDAFSDPEYAETLAQLRAFCETVGAEYIYALKYVGEVPMFVFDTDTEDEAIFIEYELSPVHERAFKGESSADIMNVDDLYGSFNTGAVPLYYDGKIVGIVSADIADEYLTQSQEVMTRNIILLVAVLTIAMLVSFLVINRLLGRLSEMQAKLEKLAHFDTVTGLPNRQYLFSYLDELTTKHDTPFAMLFIDLDNFKLVNDSAGHDAGDELLRFIAEYLDSFGKSNNAISFRPAAGKLNISARIGGDEFIQVITGVSTEEEALALGNELLTEFRNNASNRFVDKYDVGMSIGIALYPYHTESFHSLVKYADIAMYQAKHSGKNQVFVYDEEMEPIPEK